MPSLETMRKMYQVQYNDAQSVGEMIKEDSDFLTEYTWDGSMQSKTCYIYDYFHDDQPELNSHMTYNHTIKTKIDAKFIVTKHSSLDKDQVEYHIQFKPSQKTEFQIGDELYYFETDYRRKYGNDSFIGLYLDIPDEKKVYKKWLIVAKEEANQFIKYSVLPCDYRFSWIEKDGQNRIKHRMWGCQRMQKSYTIGTYVDVRFTRLDNQSKFWLPLNSITENLWYTDDESKNMRVIVSSPTPHPIVWTITKIENSSPIGLQKLTLYQNLFDINKDYIERDKNGKIIGMWADYYDYKTDINDYGSKDKEELLTAISSKIETSSNTLKVGGSYKLLSLHVFNHELDITDSYSKYNFSWSCYINDQDFTNQVTWLKQKDFNKIKIKFPNDRKYLNQILNIKCSLEFETSKIDTELKLQLII